MAKLKAEVLFQRYQNQPYPLGHLLLGNIFRLNPIASATAPLTNFMLRNPIFKWLLEKGAGIDRRRTLPSFVRDHFRRWFDRHDPSPPAGSRGDVVLLDDCFTTYNEPEVGNRDREGARSRGIPRSSGGARVLRKARDIKGTAPAGSPALPRPTF